MKTITAFEDRYEMGKFLGKGAFGSVYEC